MPVPARQTTPSLLQIDAILGHLSGAAALDEVCRFLGAELPHFATLAVYRPDGASLRRITNAEALADGTESVEATAPAIGRLLAERRTAIVGTTAAPAPDGGAAIAVGVVDGGQLTAVLYATSRFSGAFDGTDGQFLAQVAAKLRPVVAAARSAAPGAGA